MERCKSTFPSAFAAFLMSREPWPDLCVHLFVHKPEKLVRKQKIFENCCISYFTIAVRKHHDQGNLFLKKVFNWACGFSWLESVMVA